MYNFGLKWAMDTTEYLVKLAMRDMKTYGGYSDYKLEGMFEMALWGDLPQPIVNHIMSCHARVKNLRSR